MNNLSQFNNPNFKFKSYTATPGEKHLGVVSIVAYDKIVLRYKIVPNKEGGGYFACPASYKLAATGPKDDYVSAFTLDSNSDKEDLDLLIRQWIKPYMNGNAEASVFAPQGVNLPYAQPNPNYQSKAQQAQPMPQNYQQYAAPLPPVGQPYQPSLFPQDGAPF